MKRLLTFIGASLAAVVLWSAPLVHADVSDFTITSFAANETLTKADPQGELRITERINVRYTDFNHGLLRAIPETYKKHRLQLHINSVSSDTGAPAQFTTYQQNGNKVLKIGDPARTITGDQEYTIDYTVHNVVTFYGDHDELFWDINGDQWAQPASKVSVTLRLPAAAGLNRDPVCYAGSFGDTTQGTCAVRADKSSHVVTAQTLIPLEGYQTLSVAVGFNKGYFRPSTFLETANEYTPDAVFFLLPLLLLAVPTGIFWFRHGRDPKGRGVIVPEYDAPEGLGPIEVGTLIDFRTDNKDITATIIDLAVRRYITIIEQKQEHKLRKDTTSYVLRLEKDGYGELNEFERAIMNGVFVGSGPGEEVDLSQKKYKLASTATVLRATVKKSLEARGYFAPSAITLKRAGLAFLAILAVFVAGAVAAGMGYSAPFGFGTAAGALLAFIFLVFSSARTEKGVEANDHVKGLKMYLQVAEADRIKKLQSPDAPYAPKSPEPAHTVELFEKLLPYAMILGVEQEWAKKFENIYRTPPDWYGGNWNTFSIIYLTSSLNSGIGAQVNSAFAAPSSSSGSGFGGGFAGGGGGGGGGGGW